MSTTNKRRSRHSTDTVSEFHAEAPQATASEGLAQGLYVAARAGFELTTLWTKVAESTNEPPCPTMPSILILLRTYYTCFIVRSQLNRGNNNNVIITM